MTKEELEQKLQTFVGQQIGPPETAPEPVNESMIRHWCEALGDRNPVYTDAKAAKKSVHKKIVAPPTMLQAWTLRGVAMAEPPVPGAPMDKQGEIHKLLTEAGYIGVVATNCVQGYTRYLRPGDQLTTTTVIETVSQEKATAIGIGYFINTRTTFRDQKGEEVAWMTFRVLKFKPAQMPQAAEAPAAGAAPPKPKRMRPPMTFDNGWWWTAIQKGELLIQKCSGCGRLHHPPRPMCGNCQSTKWETVKASGRGTVYSFTTLYHPKFPGYEFPLSCGLIELAEGTRLVANIVGCDPEKIAIGMPVQLTIENVDEEFKLPFFRPVA